MKDSDSEVIHDGHSLQPEISGGSTAQRNPTETGNSLNRVQQELN